MGASFAKDIRNKDGNTGSGWKGENKVMFLGGVNENQMISENINR